jgi:hypothetical protein
METNARGGARVSNICQKERWLIISSELWSSWRVAAKEPCVWCRAYLFHSIPFLLGNTCPKPSQFRLLISL